MAVNRSGPEGNIVETYDCVIPSAVGGESYNLACYASVNGDGSCTVAGETYYPLDSVYAKSTTVDVFDGSCGVLTPHKIIQLTGNLETDAPIDEQPSNYGCSNDAENCYYDDGSDHFIVKNTKMIGLAGPNDVTAYCQNDAAGDQSYFYDCDESQSLCETNCGLDWVPSGLAGVGEYASKGSVECCGDDDEQFVDGTICCPTGTYYDDGFGNCVVN